jgi:uncharacterized membrane protein
MTLSEKTKIGLSIGQLLALVVFIFSVGGGFVGVNNTASSAVTTANQAKEMSVETKREMEQLKKDTSKDVKEIMTLLQEVRESQIRTEEAMKLKADRKWEN